MVSSRVSPSAEIVVHQRDRTNTALSLIVEQGRARDLSHGAVLAWKFMAAHGVPTEIMARVLAHPSQRRRGDPPEADLADCRT